MKTGLRIKGLAGIMLAGALCVIGAVPAFASTAITSLRIQFEDQYEIGEIKEPEITCKTSGVSISSVEWGKDVEDWTPGKKVTAKITLSSDNGKKFDSTYGAKNCDIDGAIFTSAKGDGDTAVISVVYYPVVQLDSPDSAGWNAANKKKAVWKKSQYATGYQLKLYRDDIYLRTISVTGTSKDLSEYMTKEGYYYYEVRAIGKDEKDAKYRKSSDYITSTDRVLDDLGDTEGSWKNYAEGKKYTKETGDYCVNEWYKIDDNWYFFDENGYSARGWRLVGSTWYYMDQNGIMQTGWQKINDVWYYLEENGAMATGWKMTAPNQWYYLNADGSMAADTVVDGKTLNASGLCVD